MVSSVKVNSYKKDRQYDAQNAIVQGDFPKYDSFREVSLFRFNRFLSFMLVISILISMVSYSMVVAKENALSSIHTKTNEVNFENIELQNKVDYSKSFYTINNKVAKVNFLKKPDAIMEVKSVNTIPVIEKSRNNIEIQPVPGY
ncbi:MAG: hypothetical protein A2104_07285 [Candidatus Melainabacteria bacterium GWF2_32_7]|nr:MAG: hypothetical protein A2104_07285 [Candidatus Melainabacteria bacterium GWF2_32_7]